VAAASGVVAFAALDGGRFVAGAIGGDVVFYKHHRGRGIDETACISKAHSHCVCDISVCGGGLETASFDRTAAVWDIDSREPLATLSGRKDTVVSVDMSDRLVVTASRDTKMRVYNAEDNYSCTSVLTWFSGWEIRLGSLIGDDHILLATDVSTVCVTQLSSKNVVACTMLGYGIQCPAVLLDGILALCGNGSSAMLIDAPAPVADVLKAHGTVA
jgi:WD40 repeat protein